MKLILFVIGVFLLSGCAVRYRPIKPEEITFYNKNENKCIRYSYKYDVLLLRGNTKLAKKEEKNFIKVVAVELTNLSDKTVSVKDDITIKTGNSEIVPIEPEIVKAKIHQNVPIYLLYCFVFAYETEYSGASYDTKYYPIGIPIALGNMIVSSMANDKFLNELKKYDLTNVVLKPGETKQGILCFLTVKNEIISFAIKNSDCGGDYNNLSNVYTNSESLDISSEIYYASSDSNYQGYINRMNLMLSMDMGISTYKLYEYKNRNEKLKSRGYKAKHKYGYNSNYLFKIGTWEYYNDEGKLKKTINYNLKEEIEKTVEY